MSLLRCFTNIKLIFNHFIIDTSQPAVVINISQMLHKYIFAPAWQICYKCFTNIWQICYKYFTNIYEKIITNISQNMRNISQSCFPSQHAWNQLRLPTLRLSGGDLIYSKICSKNIIELSICFKIKFKIFTNYRRLYGESGTVFDLK